MVDFNVEQLMYSSMPARTCHTVYFDVEQLMYSSRPAHIFVTRLILIGKSSYIYQGHLVMVTRLILMLSSSSIHQYQLVLVTRLISMLNSPCIHQGQLVHSFYLEYVLYIHKHEKKFFWSVVKQYPLPFNMMEAAKEEVRDMKDLDIVETIRKSILFPCSNS